VSAFIDVVAPDGTGSDRLRSIGSPRAVRMLREIAERRVSECDRVAGAMFAAYRAEIPAYAVIEDPVLCDDVLSVSAAMVRAWLEVMATGEPVSAERLTPMLEGARRRAAQGIDLHSMLRAYRVGVRVMWRELVSAPEWQSHVLQAAMPQIAEWALDFADRMNTEVAAVYLDEMAHVALQREHRRSALLTVVLAGPVTEADGPEELDAPHVVVVARVADDLPLSHLEQIGEAMEREAGAVLWTVRHRGVIAAVPVPASTTRAQLIRRLAGLLRTDGILAVAAGGSARGARETRGSYSEAMESLRAGSVLLPGIGEVYDFQELAPFIALLSRPEQARRFVATALEPLGELVDRPWVVPTLEAYIARQGRTKEAAAQLGVHLNTVKYRLRELRAACGSTLADGERSTTLLLALKVRRLLEMEQ
jgi:hypothetical protein